MTSIIVENAVKAYGGRPLFENLSFKVASGQLTALTGPSGSGKSTLLNCLGLLDQVTRGRIEMLGSDIARFNEERKRQFRRDVLGFLFQNYALIDNATILENLDVAVAAQSFKRSVDFDAALQRVGLGGRGAEPAYRLSGGEQQRVALARLLVKNPKVILADEPTGALDAVNSGVVMDLLEELAESGAAVVIATHSQQVVDRCSGVVRIG